MPKADHLLKQARHKLADVETPSLDARLLLQHVMGLSHEALIAEPQIQITDEAAKQFEALVERRKRHEPISRILRLREFYGRDFIVTPDVLDPRPDTEVLIETALALLPPDKSLRLLDLGTGSGIIAITLLAERPMADAVAVDVSETAIKVARQNAKAHSVDTRLHFITSSWFDAVTGHFDAILSNPPYIEAGVVPTLEEEVRNFDPHLALIGGADGLDCYRAIASKSLSHLNPNGFVAVEIGAGQENAVTSIFAANHFYIDSQHRDLGGHIRCLVFRAGPTNL
jgi:release factor glutamine methyltransferase